MENEKSVNIVLDRDAEASGESQSEPTLCNSLHSGLTVESSRGDADAKKMEDECGGGWTNERHNSYLECLENSFVKHLYSLLGGREETRRVSRARDTNSHKSTDQFTVLQNGCLQKVDLGKKRAHLVETSSDFHSQKKSSGQNPDNNPSGKYTMGISLRREYPAQSTAEASGQNFREEVGGKGCNSRVSRKRRREAKFDDSSLDDQVVP